MNALRSFATCWAVVLPLVTSAISAEVNFDNYSSSTDNDLVNNFNNPQPYSQATTGGITGGAVIVPGLLGLPVYKVGFENSAGYQTSLSFLMKYDTNVNSGLGTGGPSLRLGFGGTPTSGTDINLAYFWGEFANDGALLIWNQGQFSTIGTISTPSSGHWLKFTFSEGNLGTNRFLLSVALDDYGVTGQESPLPLFSSSLVTTNLDAAADSSIFAGFYGSYHVSHYDQFSVQQVPEPTPWLLAAFGTAIAFVSKRKSLFDGSTAGNSDMRSVRTIKRDPSV